MPTCRNCKYYKTDVDLPHPVCTLHQFHFTNDFTPCGDFVQSSSSSSSGGCYIATAVYGSYDCPQVWTLRRYRDDTLATTWYGRLFVKTYYAISPTMVKLFGKRRWFKKFWQSKLDKKISKLQAKGVESTPYKDKEW